MSRKCIDKIQSWLQYMSPLSSEFLRQRDEELLIKRTINTKDGLNVSYNLHVIADEDDVIFQSLTFKIPSGDAESELMFSQALLTFNGLLELVYFGLTKTKEGDGVVILNSIQKCSRLTQRHIEEIIRSFDRAYIEFVPSLKLAAKAINLEFTGKLRNLPKSFRFLDEPSESDQK